MIKPSHRVVIALDVPTEAQALKIVSGLRKEMVLVKVGWALFLATGGRIIHRLNRLGIQAFLDAKFHDIPNTVANAIKALAPYQPAWVTIHTSGGSEMMRAAVKAAREISTPKRRVRLLGVTVLTSLSPAMLRREGGVQRPLVQQVVRLAKLAKACGVDGVVASGHEVSAIRRAIGPNMTIMVPGVRSAGAPGGNQDQQRVVTPSDAIHRGATHVIVGRPIVASTDPLAAYRAIVQEVWMATRSTRATAGGRGPLLRVVLSEAMPSRRTNL